MLHWSTLEVESYLWERRESYMNGKQEKVHISSIILPWFQTEK